MYIHFRSFGQDNIVHQCKGMEMGCELMYICICSFFYGI